jgi:hypothetical protein
MGSKTDEPAPSPRKDDERDPLPTYDPNLSDTDSDDATIIPKGVLDPVYESKARLINRAVSSTCH